MYLCLKLKDGDIPKCTSIGEAVLEKVVTLDRIDKDLLAVCLYLLHFERMLIDCQAIPSRISLVWDGWSSKRWCAYSSISIQYIHAPPDDPYQWSIKSHLLAFN
jgi:hypothetical protein